MDFRHIPPYDQGFISTLYYLFLMLATHVAITYFAIQLYMYIMTVFVQLFLCIRSSLPRRWPCDAPVTGMNVCMVL